jgi:acetylornithine deacetylase
VWVTKVYAGGWGPNVPITVPAEVKIELYWQFMPGQEQDQVEADFFTWLEDMVADKPNDFIDIPQVEFRYRFLPASTIPVDLPFIKTLSRCAYEVTGSSPQVKPLQAPSDLFVVHRDFDIPCVHFGVGGAGAHAADEFMVVEDLITVTKTLTLLVLDWCGLA